MPSKLSDPAHKARGAKLRTRGVRACERGEHTHACATSAAATHYLASTHPGTIHRVYIYRSIRDAFGLRNTGGPAIIVLSENTRLERPGPARHGLASARTVWQHHCTTRLGGVVLTKSTASRSTPGTPERKHDRTTARPHGEGARAHQGATHVRISHCTRATALCSKTGRLVEHVGVDKVLHYFKLSRQSS